MFEKPEHRLSTSYTERRMYDGQHLVLFRFCFWMTKPVYRDPKQKLHKRWGRGWGGVGVTMRVTSKAYACGQRFCPQEGAGLERRLTVTWWLCSISILPRQFICAVRFDRPWHKSVKTGPPTHSHTQCVTHTHAFVLVSLWGLFFFYIYSIFPIINPKPQQWHNLNHLVLLLYLEVNTWISENVLTLEI